MTSLRIGNYEITIKDLVEDAVIDAMAKCAAESAGQKWDELDEKTREGWRAFIHEHHDHTFELMLQADVAKIRMPETPPPPARRIR